MSYETILIEEDTRGVAHVMLNRPEKRNAISGLMIRELADLVKSLDARVMVLSGTGDMFCAGGDLNWMKAQIDADRATRISEAKRLAHLLKALNEMPMPLIACIHGGAFGGGVGLAAVADMAFATPETKFGLTETRLGLIPATISPYVLARMGEGPARQVFMSSRRFGAERAKELGIISAITTDLQKSADQEIEAYLKVSPDAVGRAKALTRQLGPAIDDAVIEATIAQLADTWETEDAREGITAFLEKRPPNWEV